MELFLEKRASPVTMDQRYKVRDDSRARLKKTILTLHLKKNDSGNYNHANAQIFIKQVGRELEHQPNEFTTDGMKELTSEDSTKKLVMLCTTVPIM